MSSNDQPAKKKVKVIDESALEGLDFNEVLPCEGPICKVSAMPKPAKYLVQALVHYMLPPDDVGIIHGTCQECWDWMGRIDMLACGGCGAVLGPRDEVFKIIEVLR